MTKINEITITSNLDRVDNKHLKLFKTSVGVLQMLFESLEFKEWFFYEAERSKGFEGELSDWKDRTVTDVYYQLLGIDPSQPFDGLSKRQGKLNLVVGTYYKRFGSAVAKTEGNFIQFNTKFFTGDFDKDRAHVVSVLGHESGHANSGFSHDFQRTARRPNSINYVVNRAIQGAYRQLYWPYQDYIAWMQEYKGCVIPAKKNYTPWYLKPFKLLAGLFS